jgi:hypothetical protein
LIPAIGIVLSLDDPLQPLVSPHHFLFVADKVVAISPYDYCLRSTSGNRYPMKRSNPRVTFPMSHYDLATSTLRMKTSAYQRQIPFFRLWGFSAKTIPPHDDSHRTICHAFGISFSQRTFFDTISPFNPLFGFSLYSFRLFYATPTCISFDPGAIFR